jgi:molybdopterin synthase catalytic subunit
VIAASAPSHFALISLPIWKKEIWEDGEEWIGDQLETTPYPNGKPDLDKGESR